VADPFVLAVGDPEPPQVAADPDDYGPVELGDPIGDAPAIPEGTVRGILAGLGGLVSKVAAPDDVPELWRFTPAELDDLTPPLTRIINARPQLRAAVARGDEVLVAVQLAGYLGRNLNDLRKAQREREPDLFADPDDLEREGGPDLPAGMAGAF